TGLPIRVVSFTVTRFVYGSNIAVPRVLATRSPTITLPRDRSYEAPSWWNQVSMPVPTAVAVLLANLRIGTLPGSTVLPGPPSAATKGGEYPSAASMSVVSRAPWVAVVSVGGVVVASDTQVYFCWSGTVKKTKPSWRWPTAMLFSTSTPGPWNQKPSPWK